ncbi:putative membrane protein YdfK [Pillotina sp. SPG140]|jgi:uncharacterized membrane protein YqgA involved in biofilm formation
MFGTVVNVAAVIVCSLLGSFIIRGIPERFEDTIKKAVGISIIYLGISGALENNSPLLLIISMVIGALFGELINIDRLLNSFGMWAEQKLKMSGGTFAKGFVSASILFCSGSMAIIGSLQSGLTGNHETLLAKSILDGALSLVLSASLGIGVIFSAVSVFVYQGSIVFLSRAVRDMLSPDIITEMGAVGNLLVAAIGFNFLGTKEIRVANIIPALFIPFLWLTVLNYF